MLCDASEMPVCHRVPLRLCPKPREARTIYFSGVRGNAAWSVWGVGPCLGPHRPLGPALRPESAHVGRGSVKEPGQRGPAGLRSLPQAAREAALRPSAQRGGRRAQLTAQRELSAATPRRSAGLSHTHGWRSD